MYSHPSKSSRLLPLDVPPPPHHPTSSATALSFSPHGSGFSSQGQHFGHHYGIPEDDASPPGIYFGQTPIGSYFNTPDGGQSQHAGSKPRRRRSQSGIEGVKHRRTRSGCFTCRTRRVKCDETHPICERCKKGDRECTYPDVVPPSKLAQKKRGKPSTSREGSSSLDDVEEEEDDEYRDGPSPLDGPRSKSSYNRGHPKGSQRRESWASSEQSRRSKNRKCSSLDPSPSPHDLDSSAPTSPAGSLRRTASQHNLTNSPEWVHLPHDIAFYLNYHQQTLTCHHYLLKDDHCGFFKNTILEIALENEGLRYAVAAFASFQYSVFFKTGAFQTFLEFYNRSIAILRASLDEEYTIATVLTILQLASFEEYLGDWASLMEHRNAASKIIHSLWTPETMAETPESRSIQAWFAHFDLIAAMMAGHDVTMDGKWLDTSLQTIKKIHDENPCNIQLKLEIATSSLRSVATKVAIVTAKRTQGRLTIEDFKQMSKDMLEDCYKWYNQLDPALMKEHETLSLAPAPDCPFKPSPLYTGARWPINFMIGDYYGIIIVLKHQIALTNGGGMNPELVDYSIKICKILAAIEAYADTPAGALLAAQAPIGLAALWIPDTGGYRCWMQKQLAKNEQMGFVYPLAFRTRISQLWKNPQLKHTWVSDNSETAIGLTIRQLVDSRDAEFPRGAAAEDIKGMRTLMKAMKLDSKGSGNFPPSSP